MAERGNRGSSVGALEGQVALRQRRQQRPALRLREPLPELDGACGNRRQ